jgi:hypothetical protein|nr:MAG TPA: hypothetical protein [Caudoviricetes sp.]
MNFIILSQGAAAAINNLMNRDNLNETKAMIADAMSEATELTTNLEVEGSIITFVLSQFNKLVETLSTCETK